MSEAAILELRGIVKSFGSARALRGAELVLAAGEVHAVLGENGAGKSTLLHIACGMLEPDRGRILLNGQEIALHSPRDARALGIGMVHQHFTTIGALSVAENLALAARGRPARPTGWGAALLADLDPAVRTETLSVGLRQRLEISKALASGATILLLDEPSAALAPREVEELLAVVKRFARDGGAVALVTHKLGEVFAVADRVTVLRNGRVTLAAPIEGQSRESLASAMIGDSEAGTVGSAEAPPPTVPATRFQASDLIRISDFTIHAGELVGIAAVEGNGQKELLRTLAGIEDSWITSRAAVLEGPVAFIPEDRGIEGLVPELSLTENFVLGLDHDPRWTQGPWIDWGAARRHAIKLIESYGIRASGPEDLVATLSGGNQQKVVLARALEARPRILIAENPTRGLDIRATAYVHERLRAAGRAGVAVLVYSSDLDELLELAQRVLVVHAGQVEEAPRDAGRDVVGEMMLGVGKT